jgi:Galactose oxidase, central domain
VWTYDPKTNRWTQQACIGYIPAAREGHSAALVNDVMYIFGGRTEEGLDLGDLAAFRISSRRWYTFQNMGPSPSPRSGHSMTAYGRQIIVLAGEPSSAPREPGELSMVYVLDTAKIRYPPTEAPALPQGARGDQPASPVGRPSNEMRSGSAGGRSVSRDGQPPHAMHLTRNGNGGPAVDSPSPAVTMNRSDESQAPNGGPGSRLPRASMAQAPAGPPPQGQAPTPKTNGVISPQNNFRNRAPAPIEARGFGSETVRAVPAESQVRPSHTRDISKENNRSSREVSPAVQGRRTPTQQTVSKAKAMEANEAAPMITSSGGPSRQRSLRSQRGQGSIDSSEEGVLGRGSSGKHYSDGTSDGRSLRSIGDEPRSPRLTPHQEALVKELEAAKSRNAWYASELALARKAGYHSMSSTSPTFDERAVNQFADDDRPLIEAFMTMRAELAKMQQTVEHQASSAAKKVAEIEHQRDAAISEAAYARAKLAAHGGSQTSTPQPDATRDIDEHSDRQTDISRRLALALAAQNELKARVESLTNDLATERKAREIAEESTDAAQRRLEELSQARNPMEVEGLRADLHNAQSAARSAAGQRAQAEDQLRMLQVDHDDLTRRHEETAGRLNAFIASTAALEAAVAASTNKAALHQRQLEEERQQRETLERKLTQLRAEHEERTAELDNTSRRLRDTEELAESHAQEASTHREALMAGLARISSPSGSTLDNSLTEQRLEALQQSADHAHALAKSNQEEADAAAQKLRSAEERIAGLEAYQEQSSREGLQIRRQLQAALRDVQTHQSESRSLKAQLEQHQRDATALAIQHGALKDLLGERGINISDARRSPMFDNSPNSRFGTPDQNRLRELEQQLQSSLRAHEETRHAFESREHEAERAYREKLEQLDNDYQSAVQYVKGTEKVLKKMKDELAKSKTQNTQLKNELEVIKTSDKVQHNGGADASSWTAERNELLKAIDDLKAQSNNQIAQLQMNMAVVQRELAATQEDRDRHRSNHDELSRSAYESEKQLAELRATNAELESRAMDAEHKVTILLDQVGQSVGNYRRQSQATQQHGDINGLMHGIGHNRTESMSTMTDTGTDDEPYSTERGSMALDNFASELETLRSQWKNTASRNHRLSTQFDFEKTPTKESSGGELSDSLANWRKKLDEEEKESAITTNPMNQSPIKEDLL